MDFSLYQDEIGVQGKVQGFLGYSKHLKKPYGSMKRSTVLRELLLHRTFGFRGCWESTSVS